MDCGKRFSAPRLGDFDYGLSIFAGEKGYVFGLFQALGNPAWDFIDSVLKANESSRGEVIKHGRRVQNACAYFADTISDQRLCSDHICPCCHSSNIESVCPLNNVLEVSAVTHVEFLSLPEPVRRQKVLEFDELCFLQESASEMFKEMDREEGNNKFHKSE